MRLSESKAKLACAMPSVSKLNKVKQVQDDEEKAVRGVGNRQKADFEEKTGVGAAKRSF